MFRERLGRAFSLSNARFCPGKGSDRRFGPHSMLSQGPMQLTKQRQAKRMKRNSRPWTKDELALLGTCPDPEVAELTGPHLWHPLAEAPRRGIDQPAL